MRYEGDIYRPPGEWKSYLLQCTVGCSNNTCTFCSMYKSKRYHTRPLEDVLEDIQMARHTFYRDTETVFLCDGDAIDLPPEYLFAVLDALYKAFPHLRRVTTYAGPLSTLRKTPQELKAIRDAGLQRAYLGVETGDDALLRHVKKGVGADGMLQAGKALVEAGFDLWAIVITGLEGGGREALEKNASLTAKMINDMNPKHLSSMTLMPVEGTPLYGEGGADAPDPLREPFGGASAGEPDRALRPALHLQPRLQLPAYQGHHPGGAGAHPGPAGQRAAKPGHVTAPGRVHAGPVR